MKCYPFFAFLITVALVAAAEGPAIGLAEEAPVPDAAGERADLAPAGTLRSLVLDTQLEAGYEALQREAWEEARAAFAAALEEDPADKRARIAMSMWYIRTEAFGEALALLEPMVEEFPGDYSVKNNVAWLYATAPDHRLRDGHKALSLAQRALLLAPLDYHVWSTLAESYYVLNRYDRALRAAEQALSLAREAGLQGARLEHYEQAVERCRRTMDTSRLFE